MHTAQDSLLWGESAQDRQGLDSGISGVLGKNAIKMNKNMPSA